MCVKVAFGLASHRRRPAALGRAADPGPRWLQPLAVIRQHCSRGIRHEIKLPRLSRNLRLEFHLFRRRGRACAPGTSGSQSGSSFSRVRRPGQCVSWRSTPAIRMRGNGRRQSRDLRFAGGDPHLRIAFLGEMASDARWRSTKCLNSQLVGNDSAKEGLERDCRDPRL
jgi:hypothetical protein